MRMVIRKSEMRTAAIGDAVTVSVGIGGTDDVTDITLGADTCAFLTLFTDCAIMGHVLIKRFVLINAGGVLTVEAGVHGDYDDNLVGTDRIDVTCVVAGTVFDVNFNGTALTAIRVCHCRFKIESFDNLGNISYT